MSLKNKSVDAIFKNPLLSTSLHLAVWVGGMILFVLIALNGLNVELSIYRALVNVLVLAALFYFNVGILVNKLLEKGHYVLYFVIAILLFFLISELRITINQYFELHFQPNTFNKDLLVRLFSYITSAVVIIISTLFQVLQNRYFTKQRDLTLQSQYQEAQLQFLKAQINPHFLFNHLNNIYALAVINSKDTPQMVLRLSDLLRYAIYEGKEKRVALDREWTHIQKMIELFQLSAEYPLPVSLKLKGVLEGKEIEPMLLLPLVENCFKHSDVDENPAAFINIELQVDEDRLYFWTLNSREAENPPLSELGGVGLDNIRKRLQLNYPNEHQLRIQEHPSQFEVYLQMPISKSTTT